MKRVISMVEGVLRQLRRRGHANPLPIDVDNESFHEMPGIGIFLDWRTHDDNEKLSWIQRNKTSEGGFGYTIEKRRDRHGLPIKTSAKLFMLRPDLTIERGSAERQKRVRLMLHRFRERLAQSPEALRQIGMPEYMRIAKITGAGAQQNPLKLIKWGEYCALVSTAYDAAPEHDPKAIPSYVALRAAVNRFFKLIQSKVRVEFVSGDPYKSSEQMQREVAKTKVFKVMKEHSQHPFFTEEENWKFRAVHDWFSHILAKQPFGQRAEIQAYNTHAKMFPAAALPALFTEIVGQSCYNTSRGGFPIQKVALLPGFDYRNLGAVEGWKIERKRLSR